MVPKPAIVVVMGPAGSGRSNFINKLAGVDGAKTTYELRSHAQDSIKEITVKLPDNREYMFVDTPGFNDPDQSARDVLHTIADWLERKYRGGVLLTGVVYTHGITERPFHRSLCKSLDIFSCICGDKAAQRVRLVTTMWDQVKDPRATENMVLQLEGNFWKPLLDAGARHMQFENSQQSAWDIVKDLGVERYPLLLQQELVIAGRSLYETSAGHALYLQFLQEKLESIAYFSGVARTRKDRRPAKQLGAECKQIETQLQNARRERQKMAMRRHSCWRRLTSFFLNPNIATPEVSEDDFVIL
ncbi:hypothetical protein EDC04DRAFT_281911 [Pisolithus marmoratus]|nr:hypothetical protein EDC04DRAFT_281911 [Pisolithus marmoratus]